MLRLPATVTLAEADDALRLLAQAVPGDPGAEVAIDASGLQRFDTSVLAVLLECRRVAQSGGRAFAVRQVPPKLAALAALYGVDALLFEAANGRALGTARS
jgi:phospholipid transport system transporter-binding protein